MKVPPMKDLLEAGVHFGHQVRKWHPKMAPYIFAEREGVHIVDLAKTVEKLAEAMEFLRDLAKNGGKIVFLGTKKQAKEIVKEEAKRCGAFWVVERWIGGLLTNFSEVSKNFKKLKSLEERILGEDFERLTKKEQRIIKKEIERLLYLYEGVKDLDQIPDAIFVVDVKKEDNAVLEAGKKGVPLVAICDTNADVSKVDYPIPGNDDATKAIKILVSAVADAVEEGAKLAKKGKPKEKAGPPAGEEELTGEVAAV